MAGSVKKVIDAAAGIIFIALLGYSFTGGLLHEIFGILFVVLVLVHNIVNRKWYAALKKGRYSKKRRIATVINIALIADTAVIALTGISGSRYLFHTGIRISAAAQIHTVSALAALVLLVLHILMHALSYTKKGAGKWFTAGAVIAVILAVVLYVWLLPYVKRHFYTVRINREEVIAGEEIVTGDRKTAVIYFTRVGNSDFEADVDAVSGASLLLNEEEELMGNSQVLAQMAEHMVGGDLISINVKKRYPSSYADTVSAAGDEMKQKELPELIDMPENLDAYDTIILVYPLWWWTIPKPVEAFLENYDFSEKTVIPVVTHGGSGAGDSIEDIVAACNGNVIREPLEIYCGDIPYCRDDVMKQLEKVFSSLNR